MRLMHELPYWNSSCFITLTYDDDHTDGQLHKTHLQDFFREIRRGSKIRYFSCGEYGDNTGRPHYHAIIFGFDVLPHKDHIKLKFWKYGNVFVGEVTPHSCRYVCDYIFKAYSGDFGDRYYDGFVKPFRLLSKGIGRRFIEDHYLSIIQHGYMTNKGLRSSIPRYYLKRMDINTAGLRELADVYDYVPKEELNESGSEVYLPLANRLQNERTLVSRHRLKGSTL